MMYCMREPDIVIVNKWKGKNRKMEIIKGVFTELLDRFESTENLQAVVTMLNYFVDFDFGLDIEDVNELTSMFCDVLNALNDYNE